MSKPWYKTWWGMMIIVILVLFFSLIFASILYLVNLDPGAGRILPETRISDDQKVLIEGDDNYWLGSSAADITIVEFADFACPHCAGSYPKIREISITYKDQVKYIYRDFPALGDDSTLLALSARCAGEQGLFWPMHDKLFQNRGATDTDALTSLAMQVGVNPVKFLQCMDSEKYLSGIRKDFSDGQELGVSGTPTWFINGIMVEGDIPYDTFIQIIEELTR